MAQRLDLADLGEIRHLVADVLRAQCLGRIHGGHVEFAGNW